MSLATFALLLTLHAAPSWRVHAGYGGVYAGAVLGWLWLVDGARPSTADLAGFGLTLVGMTVTAYKPRARNQRPCRPSALSNCPTPYWRRKSNACEHYQITPLRSSYFRSRGHCDIFRRCFPLPALRFTCCSTAGQCAGRRNGSSALARNRSR
ncbi:hypothetical protein [Hydrogenophaga sp. R2]|uniref:hypothetical protein n=1 Tax=Hydrogenophaga sp. R2 TaxID=3132827 RepID=UPI003CE77CDE